MIGNSQGETEIPLGLAEGVLPTGKAEYTLSGTTSCPRSLHQLARMHGGDDRIGVFSVSEKGSVRGSPGVREKDLAQAIPSQEVAVCDSV
jgi:hypothetical protein